MDDEAPVGDPPARGERSLPGKILDVLSSFGLSCSLLIILLYLVWRGTLTQVDLGLKEAQTRYFDSVIAWDRIGSVSIPLPGAYLVLGVLFVNLALGGLMRLRVRKATVGVLIGHIGIVIMLAAGFVKFHYSDEGYVQFREGQTVRDFVSYHDWEIAISEPLQSGKLAEWTIPQEQFVNLRPQDRATFRSAELPFELEISSFARNSKPVPLDDATLRGDSVAEGFRLQPLPLDKQAEANLAGCVARFTPRTPAGAQGDEARRAILWGYAMDPYTLEVGGRTFLVDLRKVRHALPFALRLDKFHKSTHPGTELARDYSSDVTRIEGDDEHAVQIKMNEPMRNGGFILYQSKYQERGTVDRPILVSILAVVRNPSDQWPLWSCIVIAIGLVVHFTTKLVRYAGSQAARRNTP